MSQNRLHLDFKLKTNAERVQFLEEYLKSSEFIKKAPT